MQLFFFKLIHDIAVRIVISILFNLKSTAGEQVGTNAGFNIPIDALVIYFFLVQLNLQIFINQVRHKNFSEKHLKLLNKHTIEVLKNSI